MVATPKTALLTGMATAVVGYFFGPYIDRSHGFLGAVLLLGAVAVVGLPFYYLVYGLTRDQLVGFWLANPPLLRRIAAWILGAAVTAAVLSLIHYSS